MDLVLLRKTSSTQERLTDIQQLDSAPQALKDLSTIINNELCHRCGSCVGICPVDVLTTDEQEYPIIKNLSACINCNLCVKVCPGVDFDVPKYSTKIFGALYNFTEMHGSFRKAFLGYANDQEIRDNSTSGGIVTGILADLLERKVIDGAIICRAKNSDLWKGEPVIVSSREELIENAKPKYMVTSTNSILNLVVKNPGRYALVGIPCQIHGFRKAARYIKKINDRVILTFGLFCHAALEHEPMKQIWHSFVESNKDILKYIPRLGKHPGTPYLMMKDGSTRPFYFPQINGYRPSSTEILNLLYRLYTPTRCFTCFDHTSEYADISIGDPWMAPPEDKINFYEGYTCVFARTQRGLETIEEVRERKKINLITLEDSVARTCNAIIGNEKRWRAFYLLKKYQQQGKPFPLYHLEIPKVGFKRLLKIKINLLTHFLSFKNFDKKLLVKLIFSPLGYRLLWLNHQKRVLRERIRDMRAKKRVKKSL